MRLLFFSVMMAMFSFASAGPKGNVLSVNDCVASLDNLIAATISATSLSSKDQEGLLNKATEAKNLFLIGKPDDALTKLSDYQIKLNSLASTLITPKAKISASDEQVLRAALNNAIACILGA